MEMELLNISDLIGLESLDYFGLELDWSDQASDRVETCNGLDLRLLEALGAPKVIPFSGSRLAVSGR